VRVQSLAHASGYDKHGKLHAISIQNHEKYNFKTHASGCDAAANFAIRHEINSPLAAVHADKNRG